MPRPRFLLLPCVIAAVLATTVAPAIARGQSVQPPRFDLFDYHDASNRGRTNLQHLVALEASLGDRRERLDDLRARNATADDALSSAELGELLQLEDEIGAKVAEWRWRREINDLLQWLIDTFTEPANSIEDELAVMATWMRDYAGVFLDTDPDRDAMASVQRLPQAPRGGRPFEPGMAHKHAIRLNRGVLASFMRDDDGPRSRNRWLQDLLLTRDGELNGALLRALVDEWASLNFNETASDLDHRFGETVWNYFVDRDAMLRARAVVEGAAATDDRADRRAEDEEGEAMRNSEPSRATDEEKLVLLQAEWSLQHDIDRFVSLRGALLARFVVDDFDGHVRDGEWLYDSRPTVPFPTALPDPVEPDHDDADPDNDD